MDNKDYSRFGSDDIQKVVEVVERIWKVPTPTEDKAEKYRTKRWIEQCKEILLLLDGRDIDKTLTEFSVWHEDVIRKMVGPDFDRDEDVLVIQPRSIVTLLNVYIRKYG